MSDVKRYQPKMEESSYGDYVFFSTYKTKVDELEKIIKSQAAQIEALKTDIKNREWADAVEVYNNRNNRGDDW